MKDLVIFGTGEFAHLAYEYFMNDSEYNVVAFAVDSEFCASDRFLGLPLVLSEDLPHLYPPSDNSIFVAVSSGRINKDREEIFKRIKSLGYQCASYVSTRSFIWHNVVIGENVFIFEDNTLQPFTEVGDNTILWSGNHVGHRTKIGKNCFISSHCVVSGFCVISDNAYLGVNSTVIDGITIAERSFIGAGALVTRNTIQNTIYVGSPAKPMKTSKTSEDV